MKDALAFQKLDVYLVAKELAVVVHRAKLSDAELRDQAGRASKSAFLQLAEGLPNEGIAMRRKYFVCARNSVCEVAAAIDLALAIGAIDAASAREGITLCARFGAMVTRLLRQVRASTGSRSFTERLRWTSANAQSAEAHSG